MSLTECYNKSWYIDESCDNGTIVSEMKTVVSGNTFVRLITDNFNFNVEFIAYTIGSKLRKLILDWRLYVFVTWSTVSIWVQTISGHWFR